MEEIAHEKPIKIVNSVFNLEKLSSKEAKRRFGFFDVQNVLSCVAVVCFGNLETITRTTKTSTWLEEWLAHLEFAHGHSLK